MERNPYLDNLKIILMFLVVFGHLVENAIREHPLLVLLYAFHMPAFVFLSGITSKPTGTWRQIRFLLIVCVAAQIGYSCVMIMRHQATWSLLWIPNYTLWFLMALAWWRLSLPVFAKNKLWLLLSVPIALIAGFIPIFTHVLTLSRTLVWLPFFLVGFFYGKRILSTLAATGWLWRIAGAAGLVLAFFICRHLHVSHFSLYEAEPYRKEGTTALFRLGHLVAAAVLIPLVFLVIPRSRSWITSFGERTLAILVFQRIVIMIFHLGHKNVRSLPILFVVAIGITFLSGLPVLERSLRYIGRIGERPKKPVLVLQ